MPARRPAAPAWQPTQRQALVLGARVLHGPKEAAHRLEITDSTMRSTIAAMRRRAMVPTTEQLIYLAASRGWITIPQLDRRRARRSQNDTSTGA